MQQLFHDKSMVVFEVRDTMKRRPRKRRGMSLAAAVLLLLSGCAAKPEQPEEETEVPVVFQEREYFSDAELLSVEGDADLAELRAVLAALPDIRTVEWVDCPLSADTQLSLRREYPDTLFRWDVSVNGNRFSSSLRELTVSDPGEDFDTLTKSLSLFGELSSVRFVGWAPTNEQAAALRETCPAVEFRYSLELFGLKLDSLAEEIDLSGILFEDTAELEAALVHFPRLGKVVMCECGLKNAVMDELNRKYEDIRFVWLVNVFGHALRTDASYFIQYNLPPCYLEGSRAANLKYCTDLIALDLGHTGLLDWEMDFLPYMPHLQYLILAECQISDISDVALLPELTYFEAFLTPIKDYSPLLECHALTDLNICYNNHISDVDAEVLQQMTQLERLWMYGANISRDKIAALLEALPECNVQYIPGPESTGGGWRDHDHYRAMRDAFHMRYMW